MVWVTSPNDNNQLLSANARVHLQTLKFPLFTFPPSYALLSLPSLAYVLSECNTAPG